MKLEDKIIMILADRPGLNSRQISTMIGVSIRDAYNALSSLEKDGLVEYSRDEYMVMHWRLK